MCLNDSETNSNLNLNKNPNQAVQRTKIEP